MTKLTLDNWKEVLGNNLTISTIGILEKIEELLSLQHQQDIEQFKNIESMKKEKHHPLKDYGEVNGKNQKIDEIINELKTL